MKPSAFLFHVPGAEYALDTNGHYKYDCNYLTLQQLKEMSHPPQEVGVMDCRMNKMITKHMNTNLALQKFTE
jgi:hypothetical protein